MLACKELREQCNKQQQQHQTNGEDKTHLISYDSERIERLLLRVSSLKKMNTSIMEELFFNDVIGNVQIDSLIPSIIGTEVIEITKDKS
jgi:hypothetical protein